MNKKADKLKQADELDIIYLQVEEDEADSWCSEKMFDSDVPYIKLDKHNAHISDIEADKLSNYVDIETAQNALNEKDKEIENYEFILKNAKAEIKIRKNIEDEKQSELDRVRGLIKGILKSEWSEVVKCQSIQSLLEEKK